jgi:hypothetical protein
MNTKNKQVEKHKGQKTRREQEPKKQGRNTSIQQEHEHAETRMTR